MSRILILSLLLTACSYKFGYRDRGLPGGYKKVAIPVFKNRSEIIGAEASFTNALVREFSRSKVSEVVDVDVAPAVLEGVIDRITFDHATQVIVNSADDENPIDLPLHTVLTQEYRVYITTTLRLKRVSDGSTLWEENFSGVEVYSAPQVGKAGVNSVNPLYNHSAKVAVVEKAALDMMSEVHTRITEKF